MARALTRFVAKRLLFVRFARDSRCIGLVILSSLSTFQQMCHPHSMSDSRDKLHLKGHHPIHAKHFMIWSHSTAQVPCSRLGSTCSDVSSRLPVLNFSSWKVTFPQFPSFNRSFRARRINATRESLFQKLARRNNATFPFSPVTRNDITTRPPVCGRVAHIAGLDLEHHSTCAS